MNAPMPRIPVGTGRHPIVLASLTANALAASREFYTKVFGWHVQSLSAEVSVAVAAGGPAIALRANTPEGFQGMVPFVAVPSVDAALEGLVAAGGKVERATWTVPMVGKLARFLDPSGTVYGLTEVAQPAPPRIPMPIGDQPKPSPGSVCHVELYATDADATRFLADRFGWGCAETMPQYVGFDPGAGVGGVFQSHTPAARGVAYLWSDDVNGTLGVIEAAGGRRTGPPMPVPGMATFGWFKDPSDTLMGLLGP